jgi:hypothetical protein
LFDKYICKNICTCILFQTSLLSLTHTSSQIFHDVSVEANLAIDAVAASSFLLEWSSRHWSTKARFTDKLVFISANLWRTTFLFIYVYLFICIYICTFIHIYIPFAHVRGQRRNKTREGQSHSTHDIITKICTHKIVLHTYI